MKKFTIGEVQRFTGIKKHTLRIWEKRYGFTTPGRSTTNVRHYSLEELEHLLNIALLCRCGYRISEVAPMPDYRITAQISMLQTNEASYERATKDLLLSMLHANTESFEFILDSCCTSLGLHQTITHIIIPFAERSGLLWNAEVEQHLQPHFLHLIRRKLYMGIDKGCAGDGTDKTCLLFLPDGEHHDVPLLYCHYLSVRAGFKIIYLGGNSQLADVEVTVRVKRPSFAITCPTQRSHRFNAEKFAAFLRQQVPDCELILLTEEEGFSKHLEAVATQAAW